MSHYNNIAGLVSKIRNARYGEMVNYHRNAYRFG